MKVFVLIDGRNNGILDVYDDRGDAKLAAKEINIQIHRNCTLFKVKEFDVCLHSLNGRAPAS